MSYSFDESKHIHALDGKPLIGTTTALSIISKPLTYWASGMAVGELGWLNPKKNSSSECDKYAQEKLAEIRQMSLGEYKKLLDRAYRCHATKLKDSASEGIDLHALIEEFIKGQLNDGEMLLPDERIMPFITWSKTNVKKFLFSELHCYSKILWVGGIADFGYEDMDGKYVLGDIKSSREAYFSQWAQLGGYDIQIGENGGFNVKGEKTFDPNRPFDYHAIFCAPRIGEPFLNLEPVKMKETFCHAVSLYKMKLFYEKEAA